MAPASRRYRWFAAGYDRLSLEALLYRDGRCAGVRLLGLRPGDVALDLGCGTGLSLPPLREAVGPAGVVLGVDASAEMLGEADRKVRRGGWDNVHLWQADAAALDVDDVRRLTRGGRGVDAVLSCYALSVMTDWEQAWRRAMRAARPQARVAVVDLGLPTGRAEVLAPLARLACAVGGADPHRDPGRAVLRDCVATSRTRLRGGHVVVTAGTVPVSGSAAGAARAAPPGG